MSFLFTYRFFISVLHTPFCNNGNAPFSTSSQRESTYRTFSECSKVVAWEAGALDVLAGSAVTGMGMGLEAMGTGTGAPGAARTTMTRAAATIDEELLILVIKACISNRQWFTM